VPRYLRAWLTRRGGAQLRCARATQTDAMVRARPDRSDFSPRVQHASVRNQPRRCAIKTSANAKVMLYDGASRKRVQISRWRTRAHNAVMPPRRCHHHARRRTPRAPKPPMRTRAASRQRRYVYAPMLPPAMRHGVAFEDGRCPIHLMSPNRHVFTKSRLRDAEKDIACAARAA